jgi:hypothetical protein
VQVVDPLAELGDQPAAAPRARSAPDARHLPHEHLGRALGLRWCRCGQRDRKGAPLFEGAELEHAVVDARGLGGGRGGRALKI